MEREPYREPKKPQVEFFQAILSNLLDQGKSLGLTIKDLQDADILPRDGEDEIQLIQDALLWHREFASLAIDEWVKGLPFPKTESDKIQNITEIFSDEEILELRQKALLDCIAKGHVSSLYQKIVADCERNNFSAYILSNADSFFGNTEFSPEKFRENYPAQYAFLQRQIPHYGEISSGHFAFMLFDREEVFASTKKLFLDEDKTNSVIAVSNWQKMRFLAKLIAEKPELLRYYSAQAIIDYQQLFFDSLRQQIRELVLEKRRVLEFSLMEFSNFVLPHFFYLLTKAAKNGLELDLIQRGKESSSSEETPTQIFHYHLQTLRKDELLLTLTESPQVEFRNNQFLHHSSEPMSAILFLQDEQVQVRAEKLSSKDNFSLAYSSLVQGVENFLHFADLSQPENFVYFSRVPEEDFRSELVQFAQVLKGTSSLKEFIRLIEENTIIPNKKLEIKNPKEDSRCAEEISWLLTLLNKNGISFDQ